MGESTSMTSLMIVVGIAFFIPIFLHRLKLNSIPVVVAEICAGIVIGKSGLNLVTEDAWLKLLSQLGFIFLMFLSGVEIDFSFLSKRKKSKGGANPFVLSVTVFLGILITSFGLSNALVWMHFIKEPFLMTLIIATISLGVVVPVLKQRRATETKLGQTILIITVLSDFVTMILLSVYISLRSQDTGKTLMLLAFFVAAIVLYYISRFISNRPFASRLKKGSIQLGTRGVFALILFSVALAQFFGGENILGAFLAGVIVSLLSPQEEFLHQLDSFGYGFLIPIFFIMVGVKLDILQIFQQPSLIALIGLLLVALFISKMLPALILRRWYTWRETFAVGMLITSTLSLVIAAATIARDLRLIDESLKNALILVAVITSFISPILYNRIYPEQEVRGGRKISIVGANPLTLPVAFHLLHEGYDVTVFTDKEPDGKRMYEGISYIRLPSYDLDLLKDKQAFDVEILVAATIHDSFNILVGQEALEEGIGQIIVRAEEPELRESVQAGITTFSTMFSAWTLLKAMVDYPSVVQLFAHPDDSIQEIVVKNPRYRNAPIKTLPFLKDILVIRIYRQNSFIIPHGGTQLYLGDHLLVSGSKEAIHQMKQGLE
jgi:monovalent cation:H+ antiporter-2, CPA2 family